MVGLSYGATSLFTTCSVLEIWWLKLQLKSCSEMGVPVLRPPEYARIWRFRILRVTRKSIKWTCAELFEMNVKIEQELNFVVDNDSRLFLDAQEAKKVSKHTVV